MGRFANLKGQNERKKRDKNTRVEVEWKEEKRRLREGEKNREMEKRRTVE